MGRGVGDFQNRALFGEELPNVLAKVLHLRGGGWVARQERASKASGSERKRKGGVRLLGGSDPHFERATPNVQNEHPAAGPAEPTPNREKGEPGLLGPRQDFEIDACRTPDRPQHLITVGGFTDSGRREREHLLGADLFGNLRRFADEVGQGSHSGVVDSSVVTEELRQPQFGLV